MRLFLGFDPPNSPCHLWSSSVPRLPAHPASGTTTISTCSLMASAAAASQRPPRAGRHIMDVDARVRIPRGPHTDARLRRDAPGRHGREELAAGVVQWKPKTEVEATSILPFLNGKTARSWRGIVPFTHLAREGRMTVTIGRRELLAALGGAAVAWPLAARAQWQKIR